MKHTIKLTIGNRTYPIIVDTGALTFISSYLRKYEISNRGALITDDNVCGLYAKQMKEDLEEEGYDYSLISVPPGETSKNLETMGIIYDRLIESGLQRTDVIVSVGGGVVGDIAGFAAATLYRGIQLVHVPTSLLAQVDSSLGGKNGLNHRTGKNLIGTFYQPDLIVIDTDLLKTLEVRDLVSGLAEIIKSAIISDKRLFQFIEDNLSRIFSHKIDKTVKTCCRIKAGIVSTDEKDRDVRMVLNYGHTIAHALESITSYEYFKHGEAVIWGMRASNHISRQLDYLPEDKYDRVEALLNRISVPFLPEEFDSAELIDIIRRDKKVRNQRLSFIAIDDIGDARILKGISDELLHGAIEHIKEISSGQRLAERME